MLTLHRHTVSLLMIVVYLVIVLSPLLSLAASAVHGEHVAGECSGECSLDGCSAERSANHTCCCWQKKAARSANANIGSGADCCAVKPPHDAPPAATVQPHQEDAQKPLATVLRSKRCGSASHLLVLTIEASHLPSCYAAALVAPRQGNLPVISPLHPLSRLREAPEPPPINLFIS